MRFLGRIAFYKGLAVGVVVLAAAGAGALTYLFTDKFPVINIGREGVRTTLMTPSEVGALFRAQMKKAREAKAQQAGGEDDGEA